jgi:hypothetical protein
VGVAARPAEERHVNDRRAFDGLPELLVEIAEVAGLDAALKIAEARGGTRTHFPARAPDGHWLVELVGREAADKLCAHFRVTMRGGIELLVPYGPKSHYGKARRRFDELVAEGETVAAAARRVGVHLRTARYWRAEKPDDSQGKLF